MAAARISQVTATLNCLTLEFCVAVYIFSSIRSLSRHFLYGAKRQQSRLTESTISGFIATVNTVLELCVFIYG
jgi:hypothetical protein